MKKLAWWVVYLLAVATALYLAIKPYLIIDPKLAQTSQDLAFVFNLKQWTVFVVPSMALIAAMILVVLWRKSKWVGRILTVPIFGVAGFATWLVFANPFEMMFSPLPEPEFASIEEADFLEEEDMVLAVKINGDAVAYPLRQLAHHHIVQDVVGGVHLAATF